ncbi:MAG: Crp/Fnr family transcriptional regulator [Rhizobiaceae bacterium]
MSNRQDIHNSEIPLLCRSCESRHRGICGALGPEQLLALSKHTTRRILEPGSTLQSDSGEIRTFSNILAGVAKLTKTLPDGRQQIVGLQFAPDLVGRPFKTESTIDAEAATNLTVCSFPKSVLDRLIKESPGMEHLILQQALNELDEARQWMVTLGRKTAAEKVASFLWLIATHIDPELVTKDRSLTFDLPLTRANIADFLGLTIETVSRQMTKLRKENVISIENNRHVTVHDMDRLERRACL